jgi:hypothetical protein
MTENRIAASHVRLPWQAIVLGLALSLAMMGCGESAPHAAVSGKVTYMGEAVKGGTLVFGPVGAGKVGQPATATIKPDGTFVLGTNSTSDGALIARHHITYSPPPQELTKEQRTDPTYIAPLPAYMGMVPKQAEVEVKSGRNSIEIELVVPPQ